VASKMRAQRVAERIREEISTMLIQDISDPRLLGIYVTDVQVDRELAYANIFVSAIEGSERWKEILEGLQHAQGYLRRELSQRIPLRTFPRLRFNWDPTYERAENIERLFKTLEDEQAASSSEAEDAFEDEGDEADNGVE
jgi:ribosome-binding factor A